MGFKMHADPNQGGFETVCGNPNAKQADGINHGNPQDGRFDDDIDDDDHHHESVSLAMGEDDNIVLVDDDVEDDDDEDDEDDDDESYSLASWRRPFV